MKVCFICNQIAAWGKIGGFGTNTRRLARGLAQEGVDVHVVVPRRSGQNRVEQLDGMTVHGQSNWEVFFGKQLYREIDADIYHGEEPTIGIYNAQRAMPDRVHLVTSMDPRGVKEWWMHFWYATWRRQLVFPFQFCYENGPLVRMAVRRADGVYAEAEYLRAMAQRVFRLKELPGLLPKPVNVPDGPFDKAEKPTCVFVGRFDPIKQPNQFFELAARMPDVQFIAIGRAHDPQYQAMLERKYFHLPNLELPGFIDSFRDERFPELLSRAWILVLPSAKEAFPTAIQEASSHECAILAYVNPFDYVARFGATADPRVGIESLEANLRGMIDSNNWREKGQAGRQWNLENHSIPVSVRKHLKVYREKLGDP